MKVLGRVPGDEYVLNQTEGQKALTLVSEIPDAEETTVYTIQLQTDVTYKGVLYRAGDILTIVDGDWVKIVPPTETIGTVSDIIYPRVDNDVQIRWTDPEDSNPYSWKHTRLLRKYGSYPLGPFDGVIVTDSYVRNQYQSNALHDFLPSGTESDWYYRFFTYSSDEVVNEDASAKFTPIELTWSNMQSIVQSGLGPKVFAIGDTVSISPNTYNEFVATSDTARLSNKTYYVLDGTEYTEATSSDFNADGSFIKGKTYYENVVCHYEGYEDDLVFEVVAFDQATPEDTSKTYSITFLLLNTLTDNTCLWDNPWSKYVLTTDTIVKSRSKVYYIKNADGTYSSITNLPVGRKIPANTYYELNENTERIAHGGNIWSNSKLRSWLNSTDESVTWKFGSLNLRPPLTVFPSDVLSAITTTSNISALPVGNDRASSDYSTTIDKLFTLSMTEVFGKTNDYQYYAVTKDTYPQEVYNETQDTERDLTKDYFVYDVSILEYRLATDDDFNDDGSFKDDVTYFEVAYKTYYLYNSETETYTEATDDDYGPGHTFLDTNVYYELVDSNIAENAFIDYFDDEDLTPRIRRDSTEAPQNWWLRSANILTSSGVCSVDTNGEFNNDAIAADSKYLIFGFIVA